MCQRSVENSWLQLFTMWAEVKLEIVFIDLNFIKQHSFSCVQDIVPKGN